MVMQIIDVTTVQPNGRRGEPASTAFKKINENFSELSENDRQALDAVAAVADSVERIAAKAVIKHSTNSSVGTALKSGAPPAIGSINKTGNERNTALTISNDSNHGASAVVSFIREGAFGCHFGLDVDNALRVGGWSFGDVSFRIYHEGNTTRAADGTLKAI